MKKPWFLIVLIACGELTSALACRYTVRDVGFVDLNPNPYRLLVYDRSSAPPAFLAQLRATATAVFMDANVALEIIDLSAAPEPAGRKHLQTAGITEFPAALLVAPDQRVLHLPLERAPAKLQGNAAVWSLLESTIQSPSREALLRNITRAYAVVLLIKGLDPQENQRAMQAAQAAIDELTRIMPRMPKPIEHPPELLVLEIDEVPRERILVWSLGLDIDNLEQPQAAVLLGRGRRIGSTLRGGLITQTALQEILAVAGQDCECGLDRSWMQGPMIPAAWNTAQQQTAYKDLGFDTENPLVKSEMSRILSRGPNAQQTPNPPTGSFDNLFLGYSEEVIEDEPIEIAESSSSAAQEPPRREYQALPSNPSRQTVTNAPRVPVPPTQPEQTEQHSTASLPFGMAMAALAGIGLIALAGGGWVLMQTRKNR